MIPQSTVQDGVGEGGPEAKLGLNHSPGLNRAKLGLLEGNCLGGLLQNNGESMSRAGKDVGSGRLLASEGKLIIKTA